MSMPANVVQDFKKLFSEKRSSLFRCRKEFCAADSMGQQMTTNTFINIIISCKSKFPQEGENVSLVLKNVRDAPVLVEW
jgi:hypothetical protein